MINRVKVAFEIPVEYPCWRPAQDNRLERRVAAASGTKAVRAERNNGSYRGPKMSLIALCTTLSSADGKPSGRRFPFRLGMDTRRTGRGWYEPARSFSASL